MENSTLNSLSNLNPPREAGHAQRLVAPLRRALPGSMALGAAGLPLPVYAVVLCYLLLPSALSLLSMRLLNALPHGYVNLEILLIGAAAAFLPRPAVFCLLLVDSLADCAYSICYTYQFSVTNLFQSARFLGVLPARRLAEGCSVAAAAILLSWALSLVRPRRQRRIRTACALLAVAAILMPIDMLSGQNPLWHQDVSLLSGRIARSPVLTLGVRAFSARSTELRARSADNEPMASASAQMSAWLAASAGAANRPDLAQPNAVLPNVVLIVVESWGLPLDAHLARALTAPYTNAAIAREYRVAYGTAPFTGLTVPGEARELCHSTMGFGILHPTAELSRQCLPGQLHARGYEDIAIHGYAGEMFYRNVWYPELGFDHTWFGQDLRQIGLPRCGGAFPGICDGAIAKFIGGSLLGARQPQPRFIYWVTLNSHLPVPAKPDLPDDGVCATQPALRASSALCSWFRLVRAVHQSVSRIATQPLARPTVFILVGDHAPPFGNPQLRSQFSGVEVPYVMLTPLAQTSPVSELTR
jgi:hypothetical protein